MMKMTGLRATILLFLAATAFMGHDIRVEAMPQSSLAEDPASDVPNINTVRSQAVAETGNSAGDTTATDSSIDDDADDANRYLMIGLSVGGGVAAGLIALAGLIYYRRHNYATSDTSTVTSSPKMEASTAIPMSTPAVTTPTSTERALSAWDRYLEMAKMNDADVEIMTDITPPKDPPSTGNEDTQNDAWVGRWLKRTSTSDTQREYVNRDTTSSEQTSIQLEPVTTFSRRPLSYQNDRNVSNRQSSNLEVVFEMESEDDAFTRTHHTNNPVPDAHSANNQPSNASVRDEVWDSDDSETDAYSDAAIPVQKLRRSSSFASISVAPPQMMRSASEVPSSAALPMQPRVRRPLPTRRSSTDPTDTSGAPASTTFVKPTNTVNPTSDAPSTSSTNQLTQKPSDQPWRLENYWTLPEQSGTGLMELQEESEGSMNEIPDATYRIW
jgi:hypothetical protein